MEKDAGSLGLFQVTDHLWVRPNAVTAVHVKGTKDNLKGIVIYTLDGEDHTREAWRQARLP